MQSRHKLVKALEAVIELSKRRWGRVFRGEGLKEEVGIEMFWVRMLKEEVGVKFCHELLKEKGNK